jgi:hypothetical protein
MAFLNFGSDLRIQLDLAATERAMETIGSHAARGGWVTATDVRARNGRSWSRLAFPIWINENEGYTRGRRRRREGLLTLAVGTGLQLMRQLIEADVSGPKGKHDAARITVRHGTDAVRWFVSGSFQVPTRGLGRESPYR